MKMRKQVPVKNDSDKIIGYVSAQTTSVGASKLAKFPVCFSTRDGAPAWIPWHDWKPSKRRKTVGYVGGYNEPQDNYGDQRESWE